METNEELIETWWRQRDGSEVDEDLRKHMCENKLRLCCPYPHWGPECKQCPGTKTSPCTGRGHCNGLATRGGNGTCTCEGDYGGEDCSDCKPAMFVNWTDPAGDNFTCANCSTSCASCTGPAETECTECASGYTRQGNLCVDVDECTLEENPHTCPTGTWCRNIPGSVACTVCDHACNFTLGCSGPGPRACVECRDRHRRHDNGSCAEINNCHDGHDCPVGEYCVHQGPAVHHCKPCHVSCSLEGGCNGGGPKNCTGGCAKGYAMHDGNLCFDVNECHDFPCAFPEVCVNKPGGYDCKCAKGYHRGRDGEHPECIKKTEVGPQAAASNPLGWELLAGRRVVQRVASSKWLVPTSLCPVFFAAGSRRGLVDSPLSPRATSPLPQRSRQDDHAHYAKKDEEAKKELEKLIEQRQAEGAKKFKENEKLYNKHIKVSRSVWFFVPRIAGTMRRDGRGQTWCARPPPRPWCRSLNAR